jgi:hypothetical protein
MSTSVPDDRWQPWITRDADKIRHKRMPWINLTLTGKVPLSQPPSVDDELHLAQQPLPMQALSFYLDLNGNERIRTESFRLKGRFIHTQVWACITNIS